MRDSASALCKVGLLFGTVCMPLRVGAAAQQEPTALPPSEAYKTALAPLTMARAQADDLTEADKIALGIGMVRASRECLSISADLSAYTENEKEMFALGQLCLFGQQYEPARAALTKYLALPQPKERKAALILLARAHLGLNQPGSAAAEIHSLLADYAYDAQIHFATGQVIDAATGFDTQLNKLALHLCAAQDAVTLRLLASGKSLEGSEASASPTVLFADAIRCAALADAFSKSNALELLDNLSAIARQPNWVGTSDWSPMQEALGRQRMVENQTPLHLLHGLLVTNSKLIPRNVSLTRGTQLLFSFALWSPSALGVLRDLTKSRPGQPIYAITSWTVNTGRNDTLDKQTLAALRVWQRALPPRVYMLIVPNTELVDFHIDSFPVGIVIRSGVVRSNSVISSAGAERMLLRASIGHARTP